MARRAAYPGLINIKLSDEKYMFGLSSPEVAGLFREMGDTQQAIRTIHRSLDYLEGSNMREYWRGQELAGSAAVLIKIDEKTEALKLLHKAFESAIRQDDACLKIDSLLMIAKVYIDNQIPVGEEEILLIQKVTVA